MRKNVLFKGFLGDLSNKERGYVLSCGDRIEEIGTEDYDGDLEIDQVLDLGEGLIVQGDFNCHSHPEQSFYTDIVDKEWDLGTWCRNTIYRYSTLLSPRQIRLACRRAFSRMALSGVTSVMVSYYLHGKKGNEYDREVIAAAKEVGLRIIFGRMNYDIVNEDAYYGKKTSQESYYETVKDAELAFLELKEQEGPTVVVAPAVHSIHASTEDAIVKAINLGDRFDRPVQFHLSEDQGDVELSLKLYGERPVCFLKSLVDKGRIKSLSSLIVSDCCWVDEEEMQILADYGVKVVINPRMNDRVKVGEPDLKALLEKGLSVYLGTDGEASNDDLSITGEREFLKRKYFSSIEEVHIEKLGKDPFPFGDSFIGPLKKGSLCDFKVLNDSGEVTGLFVGAKEIVKEGELLSLDVEKDVEIPLRREVDSLKGNFS